MKKLLFLINTLNIGGAEKVLLDIVNNLDPYKYDVTVCTVYNEGPLRTKLNSTITYKSILNRKHTFKYKWFHRLVYRLNSSWVYKFFLKGKFDVEIAFLEGLPTKLLSGSTNSHSLKIAWIHTDIQENLTVDSYYKNFDDHKKAYNCFDKIICVSHTSKQKFVNKFGLSDNVEVQYNPLNENDIILKSEETIEDIELSNKFKLVTVGRLIEAKGYDRLLQVHKNLINEGFEIELWIIGDGGQKAKLEELSKASGVSHSVKFLGSQENPYKFMRCCNLYVCSSRYEGYSLAISEALILGLPVISVDCTGPNELLDNGSYGILTTNDTDSLQKGIREILVNCDLYKHLKSQSEIRSKFFCLKDRLSEIEGLIDTNLIGKKSNTRQFNGSNLSQE